MFVVQSLTYSPGQEFLSMRILLVEDETELAAATAKGLRARNFVVDTAASIKEAKEFLAVFPYRAVILDRGLPDGDALRLLPCIETITERPSVLFLTAMGTVADRVDGLDAGAQDYLVKPFSIDELAARLRVLARTARGQSDISMTFGKLAFDGRSRSVEVEGAPLILPRRELLLLEALMHRAGRVVSRENLEQALYEADDEVQANALEGHASRLRKRLKAADADVEIHAIRGIGYILRQIA